MKVDKREESGLLVVKPLEDRITAPITQDFKERLAELINEGHRKILLNLSNVNFVDSSGLGAIISTLKVLGETGELAICGLQKDVLTMFKLTRMDKVFHVFSGEKEGIANFEQ